MSVRKRNKKYHVDFRFNRDRIRRPSPDNSLAGARAYEALLRQKLARGEPIVQDKCKEKKITFAEFSDKWFNTYVKTNNKPSEQKTKAGVIKNHLNPFFGKIALCSINNFMVENYKASKRSGSRLSNKSINNHLSALSKCLRTAIEWGFSDKLPKIKLLKVPPQKYKFLSEEEYVPLLGVAKKENPREYERILFALRTGVRIGELAALDWSDINFSNRSVVIRRSLVEGIIGSPKSNKERQIPLADDIFGLLYQRQKKEGFVFADEKGRTYSRWSHHNRLKKYCRMAGINEVSWHALRHTFASKLANNGVTLQAIQTLLGHSDLKMVQRYAHLESQTLIDAINTLKPAHQDKLDFGHNMVTGHKFVPDTTQNIQP